MDYFQGVVSEYLRADRTTFINTEFLLQLDDTTLPLKDRHWYCDALALRFSDRCAYLCEISFSSSMHSLLRRLNAWSRHWPEVCESIRRDTGIGSEWTMRTWAFVPAERQPAIEAKLAASLPLTTMPHPRITPLEDVLPWKYRSWNGLPYVSPERAEPTANFGAEPADLPVANASTSETRA